MRRSMVSVASNTVPAAVSPGLRNSDVGPAFGAIPATGSHTLTFGGRQTDHRGRDLSPATLALAISPGSPSRS